MLPGILAVLIGYLLGSISPAYFLGKILKGIDIRKQGSGNAGGRNVYRVLGLVPAVITVLIDLSKGVLAILITSSFAPSFFAYLSGIAAILGHIFPFYLRFKAGRGGATSAGVVIYFLIITLMNHWFSWMAILVLAVTGLILIYVTKLGPISGLVTLPFFIIFILLQAPLNLITGFLLVMLAIALIQLIRQLMEGKKWVFVNKISKEQRKELLRWRTLMRPLAVLIPVLYILFGRTIILVIIGSVALIFILMDVARLGFKKFNIFLLKGLIIKKREKRVFSSLSFFTLACFIVILIFSREIAMVAILFLTFGDLAAKYMGILFGRRRLFNKSLEGFLGYFAVCWLFGFLATCFLEVPFLMVLVGAAGAAFTEAVPLGIDDNFTVGLISASIMYLLTGI